MSSPANRNRYQTLFKNLSGSYNIIAVSKL